MAMHFHLTIYKTASELLLYAITVTRSVPRDLKNVLVKNVVDECSNVMVLIARANVAAQKSVHLAALIEKVQIIDFLMRALRDLGAITVKQYANVARLTDSAGKQANGWKKAAASPAS